MNVVILIGRLTKDPEIKVVGQKNSTMCSFNLAINRKYRQGDVKADFISCYTFGKTAELIEKHFRKGNLIAVTGELQNNNYTDKDGVKHYSMNVLVSSIDFVQSKAERAAEETPEDFVNIPSGLDEELPFN